MVSAASVGRGVRTAVPAWLLVAVIVSGIGERSLAQNADEWVGKRIVTKFGAVLRVGTQVVDHDTLENSGTGPKNYSRTYRVEQVNGQWLWLQHEKSSTAGWVTADWVVPFDLAIDYFTDEIRANPDSARAYTGRGYIWRDKKEFDIAIADFGDAIRLDPRDAAAYSGRGVVWLDKKEYDKAIADLGEAIRQDPKHAGLYISRGNVWYEKQEFDKAIADYGEAIRRDPKNAFGYYDRGSAWLVKQEYDKAIADYNEAIRLDPRDADSYIGRGNSWRSKNENDKAIADLSEAIRLDPKNALAYVNRGDAWSSKHEYEKAVADYRQAIRLDPPSPGACNSIGNIAFNNSEFEKAIVYFDEVIRATPKDARAQFYRSVAQMILHRSDAVRGFKTIPGLEGLQAPFATYAVILGHFAARLIRDDVEAKAFLGARAGKLDVDVWPYPVVKLLRGEINDEAVLSAATDDDKRTDARCFLGLLQLLDGHTDLALDHFRWVRDHGNPAFYEYAISLAELGRLEKR